MINKSQKKLTTGFTLIEILIVVALVAILAVAALVALNPKSAGEKTRDAQRLNDLRQLQTVIEQFVGDNPTTGFTSNSTSASGSNACSNGWMGTDVCTYANVVPVDPSNKSTTYTNSSGVQTNGFVQYQVRVANGNYRICAKLENKGNEAKLASDGVDNDYFEVYNNTSATACSF